jgi:hypothetical protein
MRLGCRSVWPNCPGRICPMRRSRALVDCHRLCRKPSHATDWPVPRAFRAKLAYRFALDGAPRSGALGRRGGARKRCEGNLRGTLELGGGFPGGVPLLTDPWAQTGPHRGSAQADGTTGTAVGRTVVAHRVAGVCGGCAWIVWLVAEHV